MKPVDAGNKGMSKSQWLFLFLLACITLLVLGTLLGFMAVDLFASGYLEGVSAGWPTSVATVSPTAPVLAQGGFPVTSTAFQPMPTATPTPTASPTPLPTGTPTPTSTSTPTEIPPPPEPDWPPDSARIENIVGYPQTYNLSCESRSAVDWARYFGVEIGETEFLSALPVSDDPNKGFVGNVHGTGGQIPPYDYGVHAAPVAALLRAYGLPAEDITRMDPDELRHEIASGRPVIVWIIVGTVPGFSQTYITQAGESVTVARNEHTAIVIGYDSNGVTILDGAMVYWRPWDTFLRSFSALENMAVIFR